MVAWQPYIMRSQCSDKLVSHPRYLISLPTATPLDIESHLTQSRAVDGAYLNTAKLDEPTRAPTLYRVGPQSGRVRVFPQVEADGCEADGDGQDCDPRKLRIRTHTKDQEIFSL